MKPLDFDPPCHAGALFTWSTKARRGCAEASELAGALGTCALRARAQMTSFMGALWRDSADAGFRIMSEKSGGVALFVLKETVMDGCGEDIMAWELESVGLDPPVTVAVLND